MWMWHDQNRDSWSSFYDAVIEVWEQRQHDEALAWDWANDLRLTYQEACHDATRADEMLRERAIPNAVARLAEQTKIPVSAQIGEIQRLVDLFFGERPLSVKADEPMEDSGDPLAWALREAL